MSSTRRGVVLLLLVAALLALLPYRQGYDVHFWHTLTPQVPESTQLYLATGHATSNASAPPPAPRPREALSQAAPWPQEVLPQAVPRPQEVLPQGVIARSNAPEWRPGQPLPFPLRNCSAALFRHLGKTGGSTIQAIFRRNEQLGDYFYAAHGTWVEVRPREWNLLMKEITMDPDAFISRHPRLLVSFHKQAAAVCWHSQ